MSERSIEFHFDYVSPNAYLAWKDLRGQSGDRGFRLEPVPVLFGAILDVHGQRGPAEVPAKMRWMVRNMLRKARAGNIPLRAPHSHPFNPLLALRTTLAAKDDDVRHSLVDAIFDAAWARTRDVTDHGVIAELLEGVGLDAQNVLERAESPDIKHRLKRNTAKAIEAGVFGVPTMIVNGELFWGHDDLQFLYAHLDGRDALSERELDAWARVRASATRKATR